MAEKQAEWPELGYHSDVPMFNMKAMVQQSGIAAPTLRAWERRYAILAPERTHNDYRLYSERDIAMIRWLKERVDTGMSISQAIALFRHFEEKYNQPQREDLPLESSSLSTSSGGTQLSVAQDSEQEVDGRVKAATFQALWNYDDLYQVGPFVKPSAGLVKKQA